MKIQMIKKLGIVSCLAVACAVVSPSIVRAQSNAGIILFGSSKEAALDYCLDSGISNRSDRYYLEVKPQKTKISEIIITYNKDINEFNERNGSFDPSDIKLRVTDQCRGGRDLEIQSATWDKESRRVTVIPKEDVPAKTSLRVVLSNVRNPDYSGFYRFDATVLRNDGVGSVPVYVGSWVITLD
jgi:hypothetical protein